MIEKFIEMYVAAFLNQDTAYISSIYSYPVALYNEEGDVAVLSEDQFSKNTDKLFEVYEMLGVSYIHYDIIEQYELSKNLSLVSIRWIFQNKAGGDIYSCTTKYVYKLIGKAMKIAAIFIVDESSKLNKLREEGKM